MITRYINEDKLLILELTEEVDHHTASKIRREADYEIERHMPKKAIFDFNGVSFMDSSGIGMLIGRYKNLMLFNSKTSLINVSPNIKRIFEMSGITKIMPIYDNLNQALKEM